MNNEQHISEGRTGASASAGEGEPAVDLHVTMPDGSVWAVPAHLIAHDRATWAAAGDRAIFKEEFARTMRSDRLLAVWAADAMNWSDVAAHARKLEASAPVDYQQGWVNGEKRVVRPATPPE